MANIVTLSDVKTYLRFPSNLISSSPEDTVLQWYINAADKVVEFECDDIIPTMRDEYYDGGDSEIWLKHYPIISVQNVEEGWGWINYELDYVEANSPSPVFSMFAYSIDGLENGKIIRRSAGNVVIPFRPGVDNIHVEYTSGENPVPGNVFLAELDLVAHWYRNGQQRAAALAGANVQYDSVAGAVYSRDTETGVQNLNIGVPYAILEQLKSHRKRPIIG